MSDSEVITIMIYFHLKQFRNLKHFYRVLRIYALWVRSTSMSIIYKHIARDIFLIQCHTSYFVQSTSTIVLLNCNKKQCFQWLYS